MRWLADECIFGPLVSSLRSAGHDVAFVAEIARQTDDIALTQWALRESRLLLTEDKDFGEILLRQKRAVPGLVLLRIAPAHRAQMWPRLRETIERLGSNLGGHHTVVDVNRIRSRPLRM
jgi:predicted nuclease of predicted toxin-antitoxin system